MNPPKDESPQLPASGTKRVLAAVISIVIGLAFGALLLEGVTRLVIDDGMDFDLEMWKYARDLKQESQFENMGHEHVPNRSGVYMGVPVSINSAGMRDREFEVQKPDGTTRILMLGDSLTFGWGVEDQDTPSKMLEKRLNDNPAGRRYEVINTGVGNTNTSMQVIAFMKKWSVYKPDVIVLNFFINDAEPTPQRRDSTLLERSAAAVYIFAAVDKLKRQYLGKSDWKEYYANLYDETASGWTLNKSALEELISYSKQNNIRLLIASYPELHELDPYPFEKVTSALRSIAAAGGVPFVDLLPGVAQLVPDSLWVSPTDAHPNRIANEVFSREIADALKSNFPDLF
ncbi:MAG: SGNH/GDSL hydrolase family protein [Aestuariivirga sp.]|jgi:lysophospholipase L1-like esterase